MFAVAPKDLAGCSIQRNDCAARSRGCIENPACHQGCGFKSIFRRGPEVIGLESPGQLKLIKVAGIDLIEGRIAPVAQVTAVGSPLRIRGCRLCLCRCLSDGGVIGPKLSVRYWTIWSKSASVPLAPRPRMVSTVPSQPAWVLLVWVATFSAWQVLQIRSKGSLPGPGGDCCPTQTKGLTATVKKMTGNSRHKKLFDG